MRKFVRCPASLVWKDQRGSVAIMTAVCLLLLTGFLGFAIDAGSWEVARRSLQGAADGAAYSAAMAFTANPLINPVTQAEGITAQQGYVGGASVINAPGVQNSTTKVTVTVNRPPKAGNFTTDPTAIEVIVTQPQPRFFSGLYQAADPAVSARAVARKTPGQGHACVCGLHSTGTVITVAGNGKLNAPNCDVVADSNSATAIAINGNPAKLTTACAVTDGPPPGKTGTGTLVTTICTPSGTVTTGATVNCDDYGGVAFPSPTGPTQTNNTCVGGTMNPGYYPSGINITASCTFSPGVYYVGNGGIPPNKGFKISGGPSTTVTGTGVTFLIQAGSPLTTPNVLTINGAGTVTFTAPTSGSYKGIVFFGDRAGTPTYINQIAGTVAVQITGAIYFPTQNFTDAGTSSATSACTQVIADTVTVTGTPTFNNNCSGTGVNDPPINDGSPGLVKLVE
jgi:Flp pilus assembly protein TadG